MKQITAFAAVLATALAPWAARGAAFAFSSQERFVSLEDVARATSELDQAADFSAYDADLGGGQVTQTSSLEATRILAVTQHDVVARTLAEAGDVAEHFVVESSFATDFTLDAAADYTLDAELAVLGYVTDVHEFFPWFDNQLVLEASLVGPSGSVFEAAFDLQAECGFQQNCSFQEPLSQAGVLEPGSYTLTVRSFAIAESNIICVGFGCSNQIPIASASDGSASVDLHIVPEPGRNGALASGVVLLGALARGRCRRRR